MRNLFLKVEKNFLFRPQVCPSSTDEKLSIYIMHRQTYKYFSVPCNYDPHTTEENHYLIDWYFTSACFEHFQWIFFFKCRLQNTSMIKPNAGNNSIWSSTKSRHRVYAKIHRAVPLQGSLSMPRHSCTDSPRLALQLDTSSTYEEVLRIPVQIFKYFSSVSTAVFKRNNPPQKSALKRIFINENY